MLVCEIVVGISWWQVLVVWCKLHIVAGGCCLALIHVWTDDLLAGFVMNCYIHVVVCRSIVILQWLVPHGCIFLYWLCRKTTYSVTWLTWYCRLWNNAAGLWCLTNFEALFACISWCVTWCRQFCTTLFAAGFGLVYWCCLPWAARLGLNGIVAESSWWFCCRLMFCSPTAGDVLQNDPRRALQNLVLRLHNKWWILANWCGVAWSCCRSLLQDILGLGLVKKCGLIGLLAGKFLVIDP